MTRLARRLATCLLPLAWLGAVCSPAAAGGDGPVAALAAPARDAQVPAATAATAAPPTAARTATAPALAGRRVAGLVLAAARGGSDTGSSSTLPQAVLNGRLSDAQASNVASGSNTLAGGALAGMSGIPVVIQNTGNNVLIQSATIVNVSVR